MFLLIDYSIIFISLAPGTQLPLYRYLCLLHWCELIRIFKYEWKRSNVVYFQLIGRNTGYSKKKSSTSSLPFPKNWNLPTVKAFFTIITVLKMTSHVCWENVIIINYQCNVILWKKLMTWIWFFNESNTWPHVFIWWTYMKINVLIYECSSLACLSWSPRWWIIRVQRSLQGVLTNKSQSV